MHKCPKLRIPFIIIFLPNKISKHIAGGSFACRRLLGQVVASQKLLPSEITFCKVGIFTKEAKYFYEGKQ